MKEEVLLTIVSSYLNRYLEANKDNEFEFKTHATNIAKKVTRIINGSKLDMYAKEAQIIVDKITEGKPTQVNMLLISLNILCLHYNIKKPKYNMNSDRKKILSIVDRYEKGTLKDTDRLAYTMASKFGNEFGLTFLQICTR